MQITCKYFLIFFISLLAQQLTAASLGSDFFKETNVTQFVLKAPFTKMAEIKKNTLNFIELKKYKFEGHISYLLDQKNIDVPVEISIKGFTSAVYCKFPKLELKIQNGKDSVFGGLKKIDLNTHCDDTLGSNKSDPFIISMSSPNREVVLYRIQEILGLKVLRTKPVQLSYFDMETGLSPEAAPKQIYDAFFIEDKSEFIKRNEMVEIKGVNDSFKSLDLASGKTTVDQYQFASVLDNSDKIDLMEAARIELFQQVIFNNDWFLKLNTNDLRHPQDTSDISELWNMRVFAEKENNKWFLLAQDFNFSALPMIQMMFEGASNAPIQNKFFNQISVDQKNELIQQLQSQKQNILSQLELVKNDSEYLKMNRYLENRIAFIINELRKP
jgi:hypothetical protein